MRAPQTVWEGHCLAPGGPVVLCITSASREGRRSSVAHVPLKHGNTLGTPPWHPHCQAPPTNVKGGGGDCNPKARVPTMPEINISFCKLRFLPLHSLGLGGGRGVLGGRGGGGGWGWGTWVLGGMGGLGLGGRGVLGLGGNGGAGAGGEGVQRGGLGLGGGGSGGGGASYSRQPHLHYRRDGPPPPPPHLHEHPPGHQRRVDPEPLTQQMRAECASAPPPRPQGCALDHHLPPPVPSTPKVHAPTTAQINGSVCKISLFPTMKSGPKGGGVLAPPPPLQAMLRCRANLCPSGGCTKAVLPASWGGGVSAHATKGRGRDWPPICVHGAHYASAPCPHPLCRLPGPTAPMRCARPWG